MPVKSDVLLVSEKEGGLIDGRWNFCILNNHIRKGDRLACTLHYHSFFEVEIPYTGEAIHFLNGEQYRARPGEVCLLRYFDAHRYQCDPGDGLQIYNLIFNRVALPEEILFLLTKNAKDLTCHFEETEFADLLTDIRVLLEGQKKTAPDTVDIHMMRTMFTKVVLTILKKCLEQEPAQDEKACPPFHAALQQIQCRFRERITLKAIAKEVGVTPNYLGLLFCKHFGISFSEYLRRIRLEYAKNLLHHYDHGIEQVAALSGFATDSHFISCFKAAYGVTPKQYKATKQHTPKEEL